MFYRLSVVSCFQFCVLVLVSIFPIIECRADHVLVRHLHLPKVDWHLKRLSPHSASCISPDSKLFAASFNEPRMVAKQFGQKLDVSCTAGIGIWEIESLKLLRVIPMYDGPKYLRFAPDGKSLIALVDGGKKIWSVESGEETTMSLIKTTADLDHLGYFNSAFDFLPDGQLVTLRKRGISVYNTDNEEIESASFGDSYSPFQLTTSTDGRFVCAGDYCWDREQQRLYLHQAKRSFLRYSVVRPNQNEVWGSVKRPSGQVIAWNVESGESRNRLNSNRVAPKPEIFETDELAFSHEGKTLATADGNGFVHLWDADREICLMTLEPTLSPTRTGQAAPTNRPKIEDLQFSANGRWLVTASDHDYDIWDLQALNQSAKHRQPVSFTRYFTPEGPMQEIVTTPQPLSLRMLGNRDHQYAYGDKVYAGSPKGIWFKAVILGKEPVYHAGRSRNYVVHFLGYSARENRVVSNLQLAPRME